MKTRGGLAILVCALAVVAAMPPVAGAKPQELKFSSLRLEDSNGYHVALTILRQGRGAPYAELEVSRHALASRYEVRGEARPGIHARFGPLGRLNFAFKSQGKSVERPEPGCRWVTERGVFRGSFSFDGEEGYVAVSTTNPKGTVLRLPDGFCGFDIRVGLPPIPGLGRLRETVLRTRGPGGSGNVVFEASRLDSEGTTAFNATLLERNGSMKIRRSASARGQKGTFFSTGAERARIRPPAPFTGSAEFLDPASGRRPGPATLPARSPASRRSPWPGKPSSPSSAPTNRSWPNAACRAPAPGPPPATAAAPTPSPWRWPGFPRSGSGGTRPARPVRRCRRARARGTGGGGPRCRSA